MPTQSVALCAFLCIAFGSFALCLAQPDKEEPNVLPLSTAHVAAQGETTGKTFYATVEWEGQEYHALEGTTVLMKVIADPVTDPTIRAKALQHLGRLHNRDTTVQLVGLYDSLTTREEKVGIMSCLIWSEDPRGFPLFARVLEHEKDNMVRLYAAVALAQWNVRRGVAELIRVMEECKDDASSDRTVCNEAAKAIASFNAHKGWGFPEDRIRQKIASRADLSNEDMSALFVTEVKKWFAENDHRFPDWNPGNPLPTAEKQPPMPPGPESVLSLSAAFRPPSTVWTTAGENEEEVSWQGKRFPVREGVDFLMKVALEPGSVGDHFDAIERLGRLGSQLRNTERIPQLMKLYGRLTDRSEKVALLFCLAENNDPRALPLFGEILDTQKEEYSRLPAAYGLAMWNARRGVRELIELLSVKQTESLIRYPGIIGDEAARLLSRLNYWKSWWAPETVLQAVAEARAEVHDEVLDSCHAELKKWFAGNEHRFPDWKPGDPLPEVVGKEPAAPEPSPKP